MYEKREFVGNHSKIMRGEEGAHLSAYDEAATLPAAPPAAAEPLHCFSAAFLHLMLLWWALRFSDDSAGLNVRLHSEHTVIAESASETFLSEQPPLPPPPSVDMAPVSCVRGGGKST